MAVTGFPIQTVAATASNVANVPAGRITATNVQTAIDQLAGGVRDKLTADRDYYVDNVSGSNSNTGLVGSPFATLQYAWEYFGANLDLSVYTLNIHLANSFTAYILSTRTGFVGGREINVSGSSAANVAIDDLDIGGSTLPSISWDGITFNDTGNNASGIKSCLFTNRVNVSMAFGFNVPVIFDNSTNGASDGFGVAPSGNTIIYIGACSVKGNAKSFFNVEGGGCTINLLGAITAISTPVPSIAWLWATDFAVINWRVTSMTGNFTGGAGQTAQLDGGNVNIAPGNFPPGFGYYKRSQGGNYNAGTGNGVVAANGGTTVTSQNQVILVPAAAIATHTITLPPKNNLVGTANYLKWQGFSASTTKTITALTVNTGDGSTVLGPPTTLVAGTHFSMVYDAQTNTWYPAPMGMI